MSRFDDCLAKTLEAETSYRQPPGGPFVRLRPGHKSPLDTGHPDGLAYDDDPHDTGGRTCMGLLQREYDAYRDHLGLPHQDVWRISDEDAIAIYRHQYWDAMGCEVMPAGVDLAVFDSGVNCGVGMGIKFLQRALSVKDDGHLGLVTTAALQAADPHDVVDGIIAAREQYHRACKSARYHLKGWLERDHATEHECLAMLGTHVPAPDYESVAQNSVRATPPPAPTTVAETATGQSAVASGSIGGGMTLVGGLSLYQEAQSNGLLAPQNLKWVAIIIAAVALIAFAQRDWIDRGRKLVFGT